MASMSIWPAHQRRRKAWLYCAAPYVPNIRRSRFRKSWACSKLLVQRLALFEFGVFDIKIGTLSFQLYKGKMLLSSNERREIIYSVSKEFSPYLMLCAGFTVDNIKDIKWLHKQNLKSYCYVKNRNNSVKIEIVQKKPKAISIFYLVEAWINRLSLKLKFLLPETNIK